MFHLSNNSARPLSASVAEDAAGRLHAHQQSIWRQTDRLFAGLLVFEWLAAVALAFWLSPWTWTGTTRAVHPHVWAAVVLGAGVIVLPLCLVAARQGACVTRHVIGAAQMMMSALLIHAGGGRVEMHFHIFGSLAFLAFYRDWRVLITASTVVAADHLFRGLYLPLSVYGVATSSVWRSLEHAGWVVFEDLFLIGSCVRGVREMKGIAENHALLEASYQGVELKVQERTEELHTAQAELVNAARTAGMAEIATSVLHNVGNVLNSVNVSATLVADKIRQSELPSLGQVSALVTEHKADLGSFFTQDERGKLIPDFLTDLTGCLTDEQQAVLGEIKSLTKGIDHIKQIVAAQQAMAKDSNVRTAIRPADLMEAALKIHGAASQMTVSIRREYAETGPMLLDEHKVLQILINLISNAFQASVGSPPARRFVALGLQVLEEPETPRLRLSITDAGIGIAPENLAKIFSHGFTTKKDGHGFGLHSAFNAAREMGGSLTVASDGPGKGATFSLELPVLLAA